MKRNRHYSSRFEEKNNFLELFRSKIDEISKDFFYKLNSIYPNLSKNEKRLCVYLRLDMSSKDVAALTNNSVKSVEMNRYRLRRKMNLGHNEQLNKVLKNI